MSAKWTVETRTREEATGLKNQLELEISERYADGSIEVVCQDPTDEDALAEYCEDQNFECALA